jgi:cytochrome c-type biogenesis protein CcmH/NrfG
MTSARRAVAEGLSRLGRYYYEWWRFDDSLRALQHARTLSPDDRDVLMHLGISLVEYEHAEEALSVYERLCELYPDDRAARRQHALTLILLGRPEEALPRLEELASSRGCSTRPARTPSAPDRIGRPTIR